LFVCLFVRSLAAPFVALFVVSVHHADSRF
jgi:hypothetical protein